MTVDRAFLTSLHSVPSIDFSLRDNSGKSKSKVFTLDEVHDIMQDTPRLLLNKIDKKSIIRMIQISMNSWNYLTEAFLYKLKSLLIDMVTGEARKAFGAYEETELYVR